MTNVANLDQLLTVEEALKVLRLSRSKVHQMVRSGELPAVKFGRRTLFRAAALQAFIEAHESGGVRPALKGRGL